MKRKPYKMLITLLLITLLIVLFVPYKKALVFEYQNTGTVLAFIPFSEESNDFKMKYTHSIHLSDVVESYKVTEEHIQQYELMYEDFAIGMPENASDGEIFEQKDGKYYIKNMNRGFPHFDLRIGKVRANHTVIYKDIEYPLSKFIEPGTWIRIRPERINLFQQMKGVNILE